jgi:hypothetical protein
MRRVLVLSLVLLLLAAAVANAVRIEGQTIILPVIGRFPGDGGTQWRTDVFIFNPYADQATVTLKFYDGGGLRQHTAVIDGFKSLSLPDVVLNTFSLTNGGGPLEIESTTRIEARARIFNSGNPAGQFGQSVQGIAKDRLSRQASIYGLSGLGSRVNIGVMNPHDHVVTVGLTVADRNNAGLWSETFDVPPHTYRQFSNIFTLFGIPAQDGVRVSFNEFDDAIYGYASEVRNDTGDAVFVFGTAPNTGP